MAFRIGEHVVCGEILNTRKNSVHGWLGLRGFDRPLVFNLTGNPSPDLVGRHIRFKIRESPEAPHQETGGSAETDEGDTAAAEKRRLEALGLGGLAWIQIGPTGTITANRRVRVADCPPRELYMRCKLDEPPPMTWKRCLTLEWFSQNGRMLVELVDPDIEFVESEAGSTESEPTAPRKASNPGPPDNLLAGDEEAFDPHAFDDADDLEWAGESGDDFDEEYSQDAHEFLNPVPPELQRELDAQSRAIDRALGADDETSEVAREIEWMDDLIENSEGEPVCTLFDDPLKLPAPDALDEAAAEETLKILLARLALHGIALDMCEHFSAKEAYRLLVERVCREERAFPELRGTQWVQHFSTWEYCKECDAEMEREFRIKSSEEGADENDPDDNNPPF